MGLDAFVNISWTDLTFILKVDDQTLLKARPIYQAAFDDIQAKKQEIREQIQSLRAADNKRVALARIGVSAKQTIQTAETNFDTKLGKY